MDATLGAGSLTVLAALATTAQSAPWWFAGTIGLAGIVIGVIIKSAIDARATHARNRREDALRFIQDKRVAYEALLSACSEVADTEHEGRLLDVRNETIHAPDADADEVAEYNADLDAYRGRRTSA